MSLSLNILAEDDNAQRIATAAFDGGLEPNFSNNDGPFVDVHFGDDRLFGLVERLAPGDMLQIALEEEEKPGELRVTENVLFTLRLSSVPHKTLPMRVVPVDPLVHCVDLVVDYAEQLKLGRKEELLYADTNAEYVRFID